MFSEEINSLKERKRLIVLQSELYRGVIGLESAALKARLESARTMVQTGRRWVLAAGTIAGLLAAWRGRGMTKWISTAIEAWRWFQKRPTRED
jgi:hypothetical protein